MIPCCITKLLIRSVNASMFAQYLANSLASQAFIKNYLSGAKTWINFHNGSADAFNTAPVQELVKKFVSSSNHVPLPAQKPCLILSPVILILILLYLTLSNHVFYLPSPVWLQPLMFSLLQCLSGEEPIPSKLLIS